MPDEAPRSRAARAAAEQALIRVVHAHNNTALMAVPVLAGRASTPNPRRRHSRPVASPWEVAPLDLGATA